LGGITAYQIRLLTDNPWNGGGGYSFEDVGNMTLDQIWSRLCNINILKKPIGERSDKLKSLNAPAAIGNSSGVVKGVAADGNKLEMKTVGKSKTQMLRDGTYEGYITDAETGKIKFISPNKRLQRIKNRELRKNDGIRTR